MKFICIGGICLGAIVLRHIKDENYKELKTPINNVSLNGGFLNSHKLFDGTFEKEILGKTPNVVHKILEGNLNFQVNGLVKHILFHIQILIRKIHYKNLENALMH